jgi:hypothetical protein
MIRRLATTLIRDSRRRVSFPHGRNFRASAVRFNKSEEDGVTQQDESPPVPVTIPGAQAGGRKLAIVFTCTVCDTRSAKQFTEQAYNNGVVIVTCPGCQNKHLIADRLGYFQDGEFDLNNVAEQRGEQLKMLSTDEDNVLEITLEDLVGKDKAEELRLSTANNTATADDLEEESTDESKP